MVVRGPEEDMEKGQGGRWGFQGCKTIFHRTMMCHYALVKTYKMSETNDQPQSK